MKSIFGVAWIAAVCLTAGVLCAQDAKDTSAAYKNIVKYQFGQSRADITTIEAEIRGATVAQYKGIEDQLLTALQDPQATSDSKRYICRMLGVVGSAKCVPALAALLGDESLSHPARIALEPMQDAAAGAALRDALGKLKGKLLVGVIASVGARADAQAVPALATLAGNADPAVASAAIVSLGEVGTPDAAKALEAAAGAAKSPADRRLVATSRIACADRLARSGQGAAAADIYRSLLDCPDAPAVRVAALNGMLVSAQRGQATAMLLEKLQADDAKMRSAAIQAFCQLTDKELKAGIVDQLATLKPAAQAMLLGVLNDQTDVPVRPALLKVLEGAKDESLRLAAMECLAVHGEAADVAMIVATAAKDNSALANCARKTLKMMRNAGVNEALLKLVESADAGGRGVVLGALEARKVAAAMPVLVRMISASDAAAAKDAAKALAALGTSGELPGLLAVMAATNDGELRGSAESAANAICTRAENKQACSQAVLGAMDKASAAGKAACLRLLPRVKTETALAALRQALQDKDASVSEAAVRALAEWSDLAAAPILLELAKTTANDRYAIVALQGCLRLAGASERSSGDALNLYRDVLKAAKRADEKKQALAGLANVTAMESADVIRGYLKDAALSSDAAMAGVRLARQLGPVNPAASQALLEEIKSTAGLADNIRKTAEDAIASIKDTGRSDGYIIAWMLAGPYTRQGKGASELFDEAFAPEKASDKSAPADVAWKLTTIPGGNGARTLHLDKVLGGNDRVAYVKTYITSTKAQEVVLETGSDDGVKVWLNGEVVQSKNVVRACRPGEDRAKIKLKEGVNTLLIKVTQGGGEWEMCARLRTPDNKDVDGISVSPLEK